MPQCLRLAGGWCRRSAALQSQARRSWLRTFVPDGGEVCDVSFPNALSVPILSPAPRLEEVTLGWTALEEVAAGAVPVVEVVAVSERPNSNYLCTTSATPRTIVSGKGRPARTTDGTTRFAYLNWETKTTSFFTTFTLHSPSQSGSSFPSLLCPSSLGSRRSI